MAQLSAKYSLKEKAQRLMRVLINRRQSNTKHEGHKLHESVEKMLKQREKFQRWAHTF